MVGFVEGDGNDIRGIVGVGGAEMGSHADDEERAGVVLACSYSGVVSYGVGVEEKRFGEFDGFRERMYAQDKRNTTRRIPQYFATFSLLGGVILNILIFMIYGL